MAIKLIAEVRSVSKNASGMTFYMNLNIDDVQKNLDNGPFVPSTGWPTIQAALIQACKDFATAEMGVTFAGGDTVLLLYPNFVVA